MPIKPKSRSVGKRRPKEVRHKLRKRATKTRVADGTPALREGSEGEMTLRLVGGQIRLYAKFRRKWYDVNDLKVDTLTWHDPTMLNSWARYDTDHNSPQYAKDSNGFVHLRGLIGSGSSASADMFVLPVGFRPAYASIFPGVAYNSVFCRINVGADGGVNAAVSGSTTWTCIDGIVFYAGI